MARSVSPHPFRPNLAVTGVGSLPHRDAALAVADVLEFCDYPYWPQLPRLSSREDMYRQYSAGLPGLVETAAGTVAGETGATGAAAGDDKPAWRRDAAAAARLERVYVDVLAGDAALDHWAIAPEDARGLPALRRALVGGKAGPAGPGARAGEPGGARPRWPGLKGQITGPVSLGLTVTDETGRALLYEEDLMDGVVRGLALRARWQERYLRDTLRHAGAGDEEAVLLSVDEPYLGTFGSAYFPYTPETVLRYFQTFDEALEGVWGVHCCANTDWEFLLASPVRFVSFDAYAYGERLVLYPEAVKAFLAAGKTLLWGIVPTAADALAAEDAASLGRRLAGLFEVLIARGVPEAALVSQAMVTPACGLAGRSVEEARRAMSLALAVSKTLRRQLGGKD